MKKLFPRRTAPADSGDAMNINHRHQERKGRSRKGTQWHIHWFLIGLAMIGLMAFWLASAQLNLMSDFDDLGQRWIAGGDALNRVRDFESGIRFRPTELLRKMEEGRQKIHRLRSEEWKGVRPPRLAIVVGRMMKDSQSLLLLTLGRSFRELGYILSVFALEDGEALQLWEKIECHISVLDSNHSNLVDWTGFEGVLMSSLEAKRVISSLAQDPFTSVPIIWLIQEDKLSKRLSSYIASEKEDLIAEWRSAFARANIVVFSDFSLPMMYAPLDTGNFYVISASPADVWAAKEYMETHSRHALRELYGFLVDDLIVTVIPSQFFYGDRPWDYAKTMITQQVMEITKLKDLGGRALKFAILSESLTDSVSSEFEELASHIGIPFDSIKHYDINGDANGVILIADIVLYGSFQEEQSFPPLLLRAMAFQIPIITPNFSAITKYVNDKVHGLVFRSHDLNTLASAFSLLIEDKRLSTLAYSVAYEGRSLAENMLSSDCIIGFANLLESTLQFPSDSFLPEQVSPIRQQTWAWDLLGNEIRHINGFQHEDLWDLSVLEGGIVDVLEKKMYKDLINSSIANESTSLDYPTQLDWDDLDQMKIAEDFERLEMEEIAERMEIGLGSWEDVYRNSKKSEKLEFELNERDEGELERTGQSLCIYEIYNGEGAWPFLHHGSLYRGISLSRGRRRLRSDDVDAISRLPILNDSYYKDLLCEFGAILSIANKVDSIHKIPWIGFQSWQASGRKIALSGKAEEVLENAIDDTSQGDAIYYWALLDINWKNAKGIRTTEFWSICDVMNAGKCRSAFEDTFRSMYGIPSRISGLPPMPDDGGGWSALHSWVMPTSSFLEFVMFARIFVDSLDSLVQNANYSFTCFLGSSDLERRHCYCRLLEVIVNVWVYHTGRKMLYLNPISGGLIEHHPVEKREIWAKYFDPLLLKNIDEDLAEEADDSMRHYAGKWLWPLTGEVHWKGVLDREREDRYRKKMDKKRKNKEKLMDRHKYGYKQKPLRHPGL